MIIAIALGAGNGYNCEAFDEVVDWAVEGMLDWGKSVNTGHWQSLEDVPHVHTLELMNVLLQYPIPQEVQELQNDVKPNLPWAEGHFRERVYGIPSNPGAWYDKWPWYDPSWKAQGEDKKFSHTYQERFWPRFAERRTWKSSEPKRGHLGIRYRYGDLDDVLKVLSTHPGTRQAYLPIFFPEDTGAHHGERIPCTLGYQFLIRENKLHINYFMRSCDLLRYFRDDVYMACRLAQWVQAALGKEEELEVGDLTMFIGSLHVFEGDRGKLVREY